MENYHERSRSTKERATDFLNSHQILQILTEFGNPQIYGSYSLDLMYRNDVDIALVVENIDYSIVLKLQERLVPQGFNHFWIFDNRKGGWPEDPKHIVCDAYIGYYDQTVKPEDKWEAGITICTQEESSKVLKVTKNIEDSIKSDPSLKDTIIKLKFELGKKYGERHFPSRKIYEAVIRGQAKTIEDVENYLKDHSE